MKSSVWAAIAVATLLVSCVDQSGESGSRRDSKGTPAGSVAEMLQQHLDMDDAVVGTPPKLVPISATIDISFREPVVPPHLAGTVLDRNPFTFKPHIDGHAKWVSTKRLRFVPENRLPAGVTVQGLLEGKAAFGEQKDVDDLEFSFKVAEQEVIGLTGDFEPVDGPRGSVAWKGVLELAQPGKLDKLRKDLRMKGPRGRVTLSLKEGSSAERVEVVTESFIRGDKGQSFTFRLPGAYTAGKDKWEMDAYLPPIDVFRVLGHMDMSDPEADKATYGFRFSDPIRKGADLSGWVSVEPDVSYSMRTSGKYLYLDGAFVPGVRYAIRIREGFASAYDTKLPDDYTEDFSLENTKPELNWASRGVYLPSDNAYHLQFRSVNVAQVRVEITEIYPQNVGFFLQNNALRDLPKNTSYYGGSSYDDLSRVGEEIYDTLLEITDKLNAWETTELDLGTAFRGKKDAAFVVSLHFDEDDLTGKCVNSRDEVTAGDLFYEGDNYYTNPCNGGYYYSRGNQSKLLIASDVALTVKKAGDGVHVVATDVVAARPISGLRLTRYNYQNRALESRTTDGDGHALFEAGGSYIMGSHESGVALIKLNHTQWELNSFDVGGSSGGVKGTDAFIYTERGVHRPGDTIHLAAVIRLDREAPPKKQPVLLKVRDPRNTVVLEDKTTCGANGHVYFAIPTDPDAPTGTWSARLEVADQAFSHALRVETVKPNRLKIAMDIPREIVAPNHDLSGTLTTKYLFGAPASDLKARVKASMSSVAFRAEAFPEFNFSNPLLRYEGRRATVLEGTLDADGVRTFEYSLPRSNSIPGKVGIDLTTTVYEKGGSFTQHNDRAIYAPYDNYVGIKDVFRWGSAQLNEEFKLPLVSVDAAGKPVAGRKLKVEVYVNRRHWWWDYDRDRRTDFRQMETTYKVGEWFYSSGDKPVMHTMTVEDYGRHFIEVTDMGSGHSTGLWFYASRWGRGPQQEKEERIYLEMSSDRNVYNPGDRATISFPSPERGMALLSVEQGSRILHREWKALSAGSTSFSFAVTDEMVPNCYVAVSMIQPHNQNSNDVPMRLYGIKTLRVEDMATRLPLTLDMADELAPKEDFELKVTSHAPRTATYTVAVVDEGLLDLTGFETPSPWDHFFQKIRLAVRTLDNFDEILGILIPDADQLFAIGGDAEAQRKKRTEPTKGKRFKPVVMYAQPITIKPGETVTTSFTMPNYVGSVRVMVVGASGHSYGALEKTVPVKQPLMILPTVPRVARPGDVFAVPVSIFAMDPNVDTVTLSLSLSGNLSARGDATVRTVFDAVGEKDARFFVEVGNAVGVDTVRVSAACKSFAADNTVELPIMSPNPFFTEVLDTMVDQSGPVTLVPEKFGLIGTNAARIAFSRMPDIQLDKRYAELLRYPYGCIEQTVSATLPQLYLFNLVDMKKHQKQMATDHINRGIERLQRYKLSSGFSYWPPSSYYNGRYSKWGTSYAGHFLIEAKALGFHVPPSLYNHWLHDAKKRARDVDRENHRFQAYRLFLLALAEKPDMGAMNLMRENYLPEMDPLSRMLLAAAYHVSGNADAARKVRQDVPTEVTSYRELSGTYGSAVRDRALITYLCLKMGDTRTSASLLRNLAADFRPGRWYSTQETAVAIMAIGAYYKATPFTGGAVEFTLARQGSKPEKMRLAGYQTVVPLENMWGRQVTVSTQHKNPVFVSLFTEGIPLDDRVKTEHNALLLTRNFYSDEGNPITVTERAQGKPFWVVYRVQSEYAQSLKELALTSVFPSGWEIVNTRLTGEKLPQWVKRLGYSTGEFMDIRDDRVNWFFDLYRRGKTTFAVKINPTFSGTYRLPPVSVEAMYSPEFYARIGGDAVEVK